MCSSRKEAAQEALLFSHPFCTLTLCSHSFRVNPFLCLAIRGTTGEAKEQFTQMKKEWSHQALLNISFSFKFCGNKILIEKSCGSYPGIERIVRTVCFQVAVQFVILRDIIFPMSYISSVSDALSPGALQAPVSTACTHVSVLQIYRDCSRIYSTINQPSFQQGSRCCAKLIVC